MDNTAKEHWENVYKTKEITRLGWYEETPLPCLEMLSKCGIGKDETILDAGAGASTFIDCLIDQGYTNIIATDISGAALEKLKERLGDERAARVTWIVDDVTHPERLRNQRDVAVWHDRAMLHFLLKDEQRAAYRETLRAVVKPGGWAIIAVFSVEGAKKCSGLDLKNHDEKMLAELLGEDFVLREHFNFVFQMPSGDPRPYIYTLFQRKD